MKRKRPQKLFFAIERTRLDIARLLVVEKASCRLNQSTITLQGNIHENFVQVRISGRTDSSYPRFASRSPRYEGFGEMPS